MSREEAMSLPAYDILKKQDTDFVWMEAAHDIDSAQNRIKELSRRTNAEFVVFDQHTQQVVASFDGRFLST
jgi:hypothetical protein